MSEDKCYCLKDLFLRYPNFFDFSIGEMMDSAKDLVVGGIYSKRSRMKSDFTVLKQIDAYIKQPDKKNLYNIDILEAQFALWRFLINLHSENLISDKDYKDLFLKLTSIGKKANKIVAIWHSIKDTIAEFINRVIGEHRFTDSSDRKEEERKNKSGILSSLYKRTKSIAKNPKEYHENRHPELYGDSFH